MNKDGSPACCGPGRGAGAGPAPGAFGRVPGPAAPEMVLIPGGVFRMGNERDYGFPADGEGPVHEVELRPFLLDATTVTNEAFNAFVNATRFRTEAERFGWSFVFAGHLDPREVAARPRVRGSEWWVRIEGADWRHPEGPGSSLRGRWDHPVVQVSWADACAYAAWAGKRLPTEAEWERAARGGLEGLRFPWGEELEPEGRHRMNVWQGEFPARDSGADGHRGTAPARAYRANGFGLYQMTGNVWEWCWDWFDPGYYRISPRADSTGPATGDRRVQRGGSHLCHASYCNRYRIDARNGTDPAAAATHTGFRCARDVAG